MTEQRRRLMFGVGLALMLGGSVTLLASLIRMSLLGVIGALVLTAGACAAGYVIASEIRETRREAGRGHDRW